MSRVKGESKRAEKARQTRRRMLEAARELFVEQGYGATALQDVADRAGVAVQTIYFTFGNKRSLLKEVMEVAVAGDDEPVATMDRAWFRDAMAAETAAEQLRLHVHGTRQVMGRVAEILDVVRAAAAADPELHGQAEQTPRFAVMLAAAEVLVTKPGVRADLSAGLAADVLYALLSPELYLLLIRDRGWPPEQWEQLTYDSLVARFCSAPA